MDKVVIKLEDVSMVYKMPTQKVDNLKEYIIKLAKGKLEHKSFTALQSVSFEVYAGERVGIIGNNGAGKSTMLKLISKIFKPTDGKVTLNGTIAPLLELGAGFDNELTGRKNIYLNSAILGKSKEFIDGKIDDIIAFADLGEFIDVPLKNYSSGMKARLGFAVASQVDADIIILDEVLGVGDKDFKQKSSDKIRELINSGKTIILVSHSLSEIENLTDKCIWLEKGKIVKVGNSKEIVAEYKNS